MKGRFRRDWMRWARRAGRMERVKFADWRSWGVVSGGRPCLVVSTHDSDRGVILYALYEVGEGEGVEGEACEARDVVVCDGGGGELPVVSSAREERGACSPGVEGT